MFGNDYMKIYWTGNSKNIIGKKVKELRTQHNPPLTQKELAEKLQLMGYSFGDLTILRIENGTRFVPDYEVKAIAEFFNVSCDFLLNSE